MKKIPEQATIRSFLRKLIWNSVSKKIMTSLSTFFIVIASFLLNTWSTTTPQYPETVVYEASVIGITDADIIRIKLRDNTVTTIKLYGIDCPEIHQTFGRKAMQFTANAIYQKVVKIEEVDQDRYGRTNAWIIIDGQNLNELLVGVGLAWYCKNFSCDNQKLANLEAKARHEKVGLWANPHAIPPWEFRKKNLPKSDIATTRCNLADGIQRAI